jgi:ParB-like chromosome segregation protein Spo0J
MAETSQISLSKIKLNPDNPRIIKDDKFKKLVESIKSFPEMLDKRPLVCVTDTADGLIFPLGGNMRLKAAKELKMAKMPVTMADDWTAEQRREFMIKDNTGFGEWNWDQLQSDWDTEQLAEWGMDVPVFDDSEEEKHQLDLSDKVGETFEVIITCNSEREQEIMKGTHAEF